MFISQKYITQALALAQKAKGQTSPNPLVGAVIVKNNKIIAKGYHKKTGEDHAEIVALKKAGRKAKGAILYITLEPCSTFGKTPPCVDAIIKSGIKKVVIAMLDPNPKHQGKGIKILRKHKIKVITGILKDQARMINQPYIKYITKKLPYITYKTGQSLDGKIATKTGDSKWVTSKQARDYSHKMRDEYDAIMVGGNTFLQDNPSLSLNKPIKGKKFYKIIIDSELKISSKARVFKDIKNYPVIVVTSKTSLKKKIRLKGIQFPIGNWIPANRNCVMVLAVNKTKNGLLNMKDAMKKLAKLEITNILVEGGGQLAGSLFDQGLIDRVMFFIAPKIVGGSGSVLSVGGDGVAKMAKAWELKRVEVKNLGEDLLIDGVVNEY